MCSRQRKVERRRARLERKSARLERKSARLEQKSAMLAQMQPQAPVTVMRSTVNRSTTTLPPPYTEDPAAAKDVTASDSAAMQPDAITPRPEVQAADARDYDVVPLKLVDTAATTFAEKDHHLAQHHHHHLHATSAEAGYAIPTAWLHFGGTTHDWLALLADVQTSKRQADRRKTLLWTAVIVLVSTTGIWLHRKSLCGKTKSARSAMANKAVNAALQRHNVRLRSLDVPMQVVWVDDELRLYRDSGGQGVVAVAG